ncbi:uncharacterized protein LOC113366805 [Ctenocephalides felis]|uniref:uncharacterized protein LOC113366805 n=1 Tax=Ctenocephalides felis TaxID=7515 RepID=UPI000E6E207F|nr:uncharacterized protein LOC113366805 [Ctenocephalides felis]
MRSFFLILTLSIALLVFQEAHGEEEKPEVFECYECLEEHCKKTVSCPSKVCYKGVGKNGTKNIFVEACLSDANINDCANEAMAKAQGKDILGAVARGEVKNEENATENAFTEANEEDEEHAFRQEDNKDGLVINECYICQTTLCNSGIATSTRIVSAIASLLFIELFF